MDMDEHLKGRVFFATAFMKPVPTSAERWR